MILWESEIWAWMANSPLVVIFFPAVFFLMPVIVLVSGLLDRFFGL